MVANLVPEETGGCCPRKHLLVSVARWVVAGDREVIAMDYMESVERLKWSEPSIGIKHLNDKQEKLYDILMCYLSTGVYL